MNIRPMGTPLESKPQRTVMAGVPKNAATDCHVARAHAETSAGLFPLGDGLGIADLPQGEHERRGYQHVVGTQQLQPLAAHDGTGTSGRLENMPWYQQVDDEAQAQVSAIVLRVGAQILHVDVTGVRCR